MHIYAHVRVCECMCLVPEHIRGSVRKKVYIVLDLIVKTLMLLDAA